MFDEDTFGKGAEGLAFKTEEILSIMKSSQTKPQFKYMNINYDDLYYTITKDLSDDGGEN